RRQLSRNPRTNAQYGSAVRELPAAVRSQRNAGRSNRAAERIFRDTQLSSKPGCAAERYAARDSELGFERACQQQADVVEAQQSEFCAAFRSRVWSAGPRRPDWKVIRKVWRIPRGGRHGLRPTRQ